MTLGYIEHPNAPTVCLHLSERWQVSEHLHGLGYELLLRERRVPENEQARRSLSDHDCYPSVFLQMDDAAQFAEDLRCAQVATLSNAEIDSLLLSRYIDAVRLPGSENLYDAHLESAAA